MIYSNLTQLKGCKYYTIIGSRCDKIRFYIKVLLIKRLIKDLKEVLENDK